MKIRTAAVVGAAVLLTVVGVLLSAGQAPAEEETSDTDGDAATQAAVAEVMHKLAAAKKGLFPGMRRRDVAKHTKKAAKSLGDMWLPLAGSAFAPAGEWQGVVSLYDDDEETRIDEVSVVLLTGEYDIKTAKIASIAAGIRLRYAMEVDEDDENLVWGEGPGGRSLWVAFGERVIAIDCSKD